MMDHTKVKELPKEEQSKIYRILLITYAKRLSKYQEQLKNLYFNDILLDLKGGIEDELLKEHLIDEHNLLEALVKSNRSHSFLDTIEKQEKWLKQKTSKSEKPESNLESNVNESNERTNETSPEDNRRRRRSRRTFINNYIFNLMERFNLFLLMKILFVLFLFEANIKLYFLVTILFILYNRGFFDFLINNMSFMSGTESIEQVLRRIRESRNVGNNLNNINQTNELNEINQTSMINQTNEINQMNSGDSPNARQSFITEEAEGEEEKNEELEQKRRESIISETPNVNQYADELLRTSDRREEGVTDPWENTIHSNEDKQNERKDLSKNRIIHDNENEFVNPNFKEEFQNIDPDSTTSIRFSKSNMNEIDKEEHASKVSYMPSGNNEKCDTTEMRQRKKNTNNETSMDFRNPTTTVTNVNSNSNAYNVLNDMDNLIYSDMNGTTGVVSSNELSPRLTQGQGDNSTSINENRREGNGTNTMHNSTRRHNETRRRKPTKLEKYIYQSVVMFFMTLLPWWTPDLAYLEE